MPNNAIDHPQMTSSRQRFLRVTSFWRDYGIPIFFIVTFVALVYYRFTHNLFSTLWDFERAYYPAGRIVLENPAKLYSGIEGIAVYGFVNIPIIAYLFTPFAFLKEADAQALFTLLGTLTVLAFGYFLIKLTNVSGWRRAALIVLIAANSPLYNSIQMGNTTHMIFLLLLGSFACFRVKQDIWSGIFLAIAGIIKIPLLFISVYFFLRGRWKALASFVATLLAIAASSLLLFGFNLHVTWFKECIQAYSHKAIGSYYAQSLDSFLIRLLTDFPLDSAVAVAVDWKFKLIRYALLSILVGSTIWVCWSLKEPKTMAEESLEFSSFVCLATIISPISWMHYFLFFLLPFALYIGGQLAIPKKWAWSSLMLLSIVLITLPQIKTVWFNNPVFTVIARGFLIPHFFWGGVLLLFILLAARWQASKLPKPTNG